MFSKTCEYGLRASVFIAMHSNDSHRLGIKQIAKEIESPVYFTGKILQTLVKADLIGSAKGPNGGFFLEENSRPISVYEILEALDCSDALNECVLGLNACSDEHPCPIHSKFKRYREGMKALFKKTTIQSLAKDIKEGNGHITSLRVE